jgi:predicted nucleotidyltransferase
MDQVNLIDENTKTKLCRLSSIIEGSKYRYAVIGATAFFIHQVNLTRTTRDIDFTILMTGDWEDSEDLKRLFTKEAFQFTGIPHRMKSGDGFIIDLLPVGPRFIKDEAIWWPDGMVMNANGLEEAIEHAIEININNCIIPVAPLPVLVMLKLFAYGDQFDIKHIKDVLRCFIFYEKERRFDLMNEEIEGLTYENAGAYLLGRDLTSIISKRQVSLIGSIISGYEGKLFIDEGEMEMFNFFRYGLKCGR